ncbi:MAG: hypothetical protein KF861_02165 [Planctomycetaceae bacterium]|nr:hypothetical protein [Planctomycetaceae bacterium]
MSGINQGLAQLHKLLQQLQAVNDQLQRGPRQVQAREQLVVKAEEQLAASRANLKQAKANADRKALELRTNEAKIADLQAKLNAASSNREYDLIRGHIEADRVAVSVLEDEILEALEVVDRLQIECAESEQRAGKAVEEKTRCAEQVAEAESGLRLQVEGLAARVRDAERVIPAEIAVQYRRLVETYGAEALASVDGKICTNCYVALTPQTCVSLNSGRAMFCHCGRLLYLPGGE